MTYIVICASQLVKIAKIPTKQIYKLKREKVCGVNKENKKKKKKVDGRKKKKQIIISLKIRNKTGQNKREKQTT